MLRSLVYRDLFGVGEEQARQILLEAVAGPRRPDQKPMFPGHGTLGGISRLGALAPRPPGSLPRVWNIPARNPGFTGRDELLVAMRERLLADRAVPLALQGLGGVGKTLLPVSRAVQDVVRIFPGGESSTSARAARYMAIACVGSCICRADSCSIFARR